MADVVAPEQNGNSVVNDHPVPESEAKALVMAKLFAEQWGVDFPFGFIIDDVWYIYPNAHTVHFAFSSEEAASIYRSPAS